MDASLDIKMMVEDLENNILSGLVLVLVVIFLAMGIRNALMVSFAIPMSMLISFNRHGCNVEHGGAVQSDVGPGSAGGQCHRDCGKHLPVVEQGVPGGAAMRATEEVAWPVSILPLTTLGAFLPCCSGRVPREFMDNMPLTLIITLSSSLFVAGDQSGNIASFFIKPKFPVDTLGISLRIRRPGGETR